MNLDTSQIEFSHKDRLRKIKLPKKLNSLLAEDLGFHIGDGHMSIQMSNEGYKRYGFNYSGDKRYDKEYFNNILIKRKNRLFNISCKSRNYKYKNEIICTFNSKAILQFFNKIFCVPLNKKDNISIPKIILNSNKKVKAAFLRGLFDSDGSLCLKNRKNNIYPTINLTSKSKRLIANTLRLLNEFKFSVTSYNRDRYDKRTFKRYKQSCLDINGANMVKKWMKDIRFNNKKHLIKYYKWAQGESNSRSSPYLEFM